MRNPGRGRRRGSGATTRPPSLLRRRRSLRLRAEGRERRGPRGAAMEACGGGPCGPLTSESEPSPSMVAFCQVSSTAASKQADGRPGQGLVGGSLRRPWSLGSEPEGELVSRTRPADRRGEERGGRKHRRGEPSCAPCDGPGIPPRGRLRRRLLQTAAGRAAARRPKRRRRGGAGPGRGGAVAGATAPTAQRGRGGGRQAEAGRGSGAR